MAFLDFSGKSVWWRTCETTSLDEAKRRFMREGVLQLRARLHGGDRVTIEMTQPWSCSNAVTIRVTDREYADSEEIVMIDDRMISQHLYSSRLIPDVRAIDWNYPQY